MSRTALITGITGQDGSYLAEFLLQKGYAVHGMVRRSSTENFERISHLRSAVTLHQADLLDELSLIELMQQVRPDEIYNLAAMSFVPTSWTQPILTSEFTAIGVVRVLEAMRRVCPKARFYQASSSEMFGHVRETPQTEKTPFYPRSPYGVAKAFGHYITVNYRESYQLFAVSGILFNHESPRRGMEFVTRKVSDGVARIKLGLQQTLAMGNLDAKRDWGHARDYVEMQWLMLQQDAPDDFIIATGVQYSVRDFINAAAEDLGMKIVWEGQGVEEKGYWLKPTSHQDKVRKLIVQVDPRYFRPTEVETLLGDPTKAKEKLGWTPRIGFKELVSEMVRADLLFAERDELIKKHGYTIYNRNE